MDDPALRSRLDAALFLLLVNCLLALGTGPQYAPETTVGVVVLAALIGYGHVRGARSTG